MILFKHIASVVTILAALTASVWGYSAKWTKLIDRVNLKADKTEVRSNSQKLDIIICYLDKNKCFKQE